MPPGFLQQLSNSVRAFGEGVKIGATIDVLRKHYNLIADNAWSQQTLTGYCQIGLADQCDEHELAVWFLADFARYFIDPQNPKSKTEVKKYLRVANDSLVNGALHNLQPLLALREVAEQLYGLGPYGEDLPPEKDSVYEPTPNGDTSPTRTQEEIGTDEEDEEYSSLTEYEEYWPDIAVAEQLRSRTECQMLQTGILNGLQQLLSHPEHILQPTTFSSEEENILQKYFKDWPDISRAEGMKRRAERHVFISEITNRCRSKLGLNPQASASRPMLFSKEELDYLYQYEADWPDISKWERERRDSDRETLINNLLDELREILTEAASMAKLNSPGR